MSEENKLNQLFGDQKVWKAKSGGGYEIKWCDLCETFSIWCPKCNNGSCNCSSCDICHKDFSEFCATKCYLEYYLNDEEKLVLQKADFLKKYIPTSLAAGFSEINWKYLSEHGQLCRHSFELFDLEKQGCSMDDYKK